MVRAFRRFGWSATALAIAFLAPAVATAQPQEESEEAVSFSRQVQPILMDNCLACHGPDGDARKADLRLDDRLAAIDAGAVTPGEPGESELIARITSDDPDERMPPPDHHDQLTEQQIETLTQWVEQGAEYEPHWAFQAITRPEVPEVPEADWPRNPIDHFVMDRLEQEGLSPAPEADRRTLARRVALDLTGLPPTPEQVEQFVNDESADAYEQYVDRMLNSVHWGEHRARYWLDVARYADTHGLHFDNERRMWAYRDWVIQAFNDNMPFDQFTVEQLGGDLLPDPDLDQLVATGFNRCNVTTNEGGTIEEEVLVQYMQDRVETTATAFLGLTASCAACHDHKYDPLTQQEYYQLAAFFNNITQNAMDGNTPETPPIIFVPQADDRDRWNQLPGEIADAEAELEAHQPEARQQYEQWLAEREVKQQDELGDTVSTDNLHLHAPLTRGESAGTLAVERDGESESVNIANTPAWVEGPQGGEVFSSRGGAAVELPEAGDFEKDAGFSFGAWVRFDGGRQGAIFARMNANNAHRGWDLWVEGGQVGTHLINRWPEDALKVVTQEPLPEGEWKHVFVTYDGSSKAEGVSIYVDGEKQAVNVASDQLSSSIRSDVPLKLAQRNNSARIDNLGLYDMRLYKRTLSADEVARIGKEDQVRRLLAKRSENLTDAEKDVLFGWWRVEHDEAGNALRDQVAALKQERDAIENRGTTTHIMKERDEPAIAHVLFRGEYDQREEQVSPEVPEMLPPMPKDLPRNRLGFAKWLVMDENPLTARVTVNRFWQQVFGRGIVNTAGDFGMAGEHPSHPELLDWLAVEFRTNGWDVKDLFRTIVTSATYRQAAVMNPDKLEKDPDNVLLSRGPRFRMDGEMVRDYALATSGLLVPEIGGPSVKPYQPDGVWEAVAMPGSNTRFYERDSGDGLYRRSMYTFWKRSAPPAFLDIFNATTREHCTITRDRTNTPLQALATLNDVQLIEAARHAAERALLEADGSTAATLDHLARHIMLRPLRSDEQSVMRESVAELEAHYQDHPDAAGELVTHGETAPSDTLAEPKLAAWTMVANQLYNLDEVLIK